MTDDSRLNSIVFPTIGGVVFLILVAAVVTYFMSKKGMLDQAETQHQAMRRQNGLWTGSSQNEPVNEDAVPEEKV